MPLKFLESASNKIFIQELREVTGDGISVFHPVKKNVIREEDLHECDGKIMKFMIF